MHRPFTETPHPLVRKLESIFELTDEEEGALRALPIMAREVRAEQDIVRDGDRPSQCCVLLDGFAFRYKLSGEDRRQILAFHIPGEIPDLQSLHLTMMDHSLAALTPARIGFIQHRDMRELMTAHPRLTAAFWREALVDAAIFREWVVNLGQRATLGRMAHLLCEIYLRLDSIGLAENGTVPFPIIQAQLGDALGVSSVHTNRSLQELRARGLVTLEGRKLTIHDWDSLAELGEFDPAFLHLVDERRRPAA